MKQFKPSKVQQSTIQVPEPFETRWQYTEYLNILRSAGLSTQPPESGGYTQDQLIAITKVMGRVPDGYDLSGVLDQYLFDTPEISQDPAFIPLTPVRVSLLPRSVMAANVIDTNSQSILQGFTDTRFATLQAHRVSGGNIVKYATPLSKAGITATQIRAENIENEPWAKNLESLQNFSGTLVYNAKPIDSNKKINGVLVKNTKQGLTDAVFSQPATSGGRPFDPTTSLTQPQLEVNTSNIRFNRFPEIDITAKIYNSVGRSEPAGATARALITQPTPEALINVSDIPEDSELIINGQLINIQTRSAEEFVSLVNAQVADVHADFYTEQGIQYVVLQSKTSKPISFANGRAPGSLLEIAGFDIVRDQLETQIVNAQTGDIDQFEIQAASRGYRVGDRLRLVGGEPVKSEAGALGEITIQNPGAGYVNPDQIEVIINPGNKAPGRGARAQVTSLTDTGGIKTIDMISLGAGYSSDRPPEILIRDLSPSQITPTVIDAAYIDTVTVPAGEILRIESTEWLTDASGRLGTKITHRRHVRSTAEVTLGAAETAQISGTYTLNTTGAPNRVTISNVTMTDAWAKNIRPASYVEITTDAGTKLMWVPVPLTESDIVVGTTSFQVQVPEFQTQADVDSFFTGDVDIETREPWWQNLVGTASDRPRLIPCPDPDIARNPAKLTATVGVYLGRVLRGPERVAKFLVTAVNSQGSITAMRMLDPGKYTVIPQEVQLGVPLEYDYASPGLPSTPENNLIIDALRAHSLGVADPSAGHTQYGTSANPASLATELDNLRHPDWSEAPEFYFNGTEFVPYTGTPGAYDPETFVQVDAEEYLRKIYNIDLEDGVYVDQETVAGGTNASIRITQATSTESIERSIARETLDLPEQVSEVHQPRHLVRILNRALRLAEYASADMEFQVVPISADVSEIRLVSKYPIINLTSATPGILSALGLPEGDYTQPLLQIEVQNDQVETSDLDATRQQQQAVNLLTVQQTGILGDARDTPNGLSFSNVRNINTKSDNLSIFAGAPVQSRSELFKYTLASIHGNPVRMSGSDRQSAQVNILQSRRYNSENPVPELPGNPFYRADGTGFSLGDPLASLPHAWLDNYQGQGWAYFQSGKLIAQQEPLVDVNKLGRNLAYDAESGDRVTDLHVFDPFKGVLPGFIRNEIRHISDVDPVGYNTGRTQFGKPQVGQVWWDTSTLRYEWYEQGSNQQRRAQWGKLFPGSTITLAEWVESRSLPQNWSGDGKPRYTDRFITERRLDPDTGKYELYYYYWVQNRDQLESAAVSAGRKFDTQTLARYIANPQAYGLTLLNVVSADAIALSNMADYVTHSDTHLQLTINAENKLDGIDHTAWKLMREGDRVSVVPDHLSRKLVDSLAGENAIGQAVPDPRLSVVEKLGIGFRPRQTMFGDLTEARRVMQSVLNRMLAGIKLNSQFSGWDSGFLADMQYIRPINWYEVQSVDPVTNEEIRFTDDDKPIFTVNSQDELYTLRNLPDGTIVQVDSNDRARSELWRFQAITGRFFQIAVFSETIRLRDSIWQDEPNPRQSTEIRLILESLRDRVFTNTSQWNELFFEMLKHAYVEQGQLSWAFKTSMLYIEKQENDLTQVTGFKADNFSRVLEYMNEVKPYSAKIREYRDGKRAPIELIGQNNLSDYDKPPYVDPTTGSVRILDDNSPVDREIMANDARFIDYFTASDKSLSPIRRIKNTLVFDRTNWRLTEFAWNPQIESENFSIAKNIVSIIQTPATMLGSKPETRAVDRIFKFDQEVQQIFQLELAEFFNDLAAFENPDIVGNVAAIHQILDAGQLKRTLDLVKEKVGGGFRGEELDGGIFSRNQQRTEFLIDDIVDFGWDNKAWDENTDGDTNVFVDDRNVENYGIVTSVGIGDVAWDTSITIVSYEGQFGEVDQNIAFRINDDIIDGFDGVTFQRVLYGEERPEELALLSPLEGIIMTVTTSENGLIPAGASIYDELPADSETLDKNQIVFSVDSVNILNPGIGWTTPTVEFFDPTGNQPTITALGTAQVNAAGEITGITVTNAGAGYRAVAIRVTQTQATAVNSPGAPVGSSVIPITTTNLRVGQRITTTAGVSVGLVTNVGTNQITISEIISSPLPAGTVLQFSGDQFEATVDLTPTTNILPAESTDSEFFWINELTGFDSLETPITTPVGEEDFFGNSTEPGAWDIIVKESEDEFALSPVSDDAQTVIFRVHQDLLGGTEFYRVDSEFTSTLVSDVLADSTEIQLANADWLENVTSDNPGLIWVNNELIQYGFRFGNVLSTLTRGVRGTTISDHTAGDLAIRADATERFTDLGAKQSVWISSELGQAASLADRGNANVTAIMSFLHKL